MDRAGLAAVILACLWSAACRTGEGRPGLPPEPRPADPAPAATLDALHAAASRADADGYFALFAPGAVFLGTDASERWELPAFRAWAGPIFASGRGWTYVPIERHLVLAPSGDVAWFDERLHNERYGETRGSGVLVRRDGAWLVAQYVLSFPVPNELAGDLVERIRALPAGAAGDR